MIPHESGYALLDKSPGLTSFEALGDIKKASGIAKIGHTGTLDKFASGLLLVLAGRAVKLTPWFSGCDKLYRGLIRFGVETDTLDPEGEVVAEGEIPSLEALESALSPFRGEISQIPPEYSAIHVKGKRAHELARSGKQVELEPRAITIHSLELLSYDPPFAEIRVHCSKGTYIRALARDIGRAAGSRARLESLRREGIGNLRLPEPSESGIPPIKPLDPLIFEALNIPTIRIEGDFVSEIVQGKPLTALLQSNLFSQRESPPPETGALGAFSQNGEFIALIERKEQASGGLKWSYGYVYARP